MKSSNELKPLWTPDPKNVLKTNLSLFGNKAAEKYGFKEGDYESLLGGINGKRACILPMTML